MSVIHLGWTPNPEGVARIIEDPSVPVYSMTEAQFQAMKPSELEATGKPPVILFDALKRLEPTWERGNQGIGDCVSWGWELATTLTTAVDIHTKMRPFVWPGQFATEPYYGGSRVEARGVKRGGYSDGSYGAAAAKFGTKWGALSRSDWSKHTGNPEHDLRKYSAKKAKEWGNFGNGGAFDKDALDNLAKLYGLKEAPQITSFEQAVAVIESGFAIAVCSDQGLSGKRDQNGFVRPSGTWLHCMVFSGVRYDRSGLLITNSWGNSWGLGNFYRDVSTGEEIDYWPAVQKCSAWLDPRTCDRMLKQGDSFAVCGVSGLQRRKIDWMKGWTR